MRYKREDFPKKTKNVVIEFPELCEAAPSADIAALKAVVAKHNKAVDGMLKDPPIQRKKAEQISWR